MISYIIYTFHTKVRGMGISVRNIVFYHFTRVSRSIQPNLITLVAPNINLTHNLMTLSNQA